jgi:hypothetical protein
VILTYDKRQAYWNWCREFIDREAIYRVGRFRFTRRAGSSIGAQ